MMWPSSPGFTWAHLVQDAPPEVVGFVLWPVFAGESFPGWCVVKTERGAVECFVYPVHHRLGWPPGELARAVRRALGRVRAVRPKAALWVPVPAPGEWFRRQVRDGLWGIGVPVAVTDGSPPRWADFSFPPATTPGPPPPTGKSPPDVGKGGEMLGRLARWREASGREMRVLWAKELAEEGIRRGWLEVTNDGCRITRRGIIALRRAWHVPPGTLPGRERNRGSSGRHRLLSRLWGVELTRRGEEVWADWSEVEHVVGVFVRPDALAVGRRRGRETLFWLEVESGHRSREETAGKVRRRLAAVARMGWPVVFEVRGPAWVVEAVQIGLNGVVVPDHVEVNVTVWKA